MKSFSTMMFGFCLLLTASTYGAPAMEDSADGSTTASPSDEDATILSAMARQPRFLNIGNIDIGCTINCAKFHACRVRCLFGLRCTCTAPSGCNCDRFAWE